MHKSICSLTIPLFHHAHQMRNGLGRPILASDLLSHQASQSPEVLLRVCVLVRSLISTNGPILVHQNQGFSTSEHSLLTQTQYPKYISDADVTLIYLIDIGKFGDSTCLGVFSDKKLCLTSRFYSRRAYKLTQVFSCFCFVFVLHRGINRTSTMNTNDTNNLLAPTSVGRCLYHSPLWTVRRVRAQRINMRAIITEPLWSCQNSNCCRDSGQSRATSLTRAHHGQVWLDGNGWEEVICIPFFLFILSLSFSPI